MHHQALACDYNLLKLVQIPYGSFMRSRHETFPSSFECRFSVYMYLTFHLTPVLRQTCYQMAQTHLGHEFKCDSDSNTSSTSTVTGADVWHSPTLREVTHHKSLRFWVLWTKIAAKTLILLWSVWGWLGHLCLSPRAKEIASRGSQYSGVRRDWNSLQLFTLYSSWRSHSFLWEHDEVANNKVKGC